MEHTWIVVFVSPWLKISLDKLKYSRLLNEGCSAMTPPVSFYLFDIDQISVGVSTVSAFKFKPKVNKLEITCVHNCLSLFKITFVQQLFLFIPVMLFWIGSNFQ